MTTCPKCGAENPHDASFCSICGNTLINAPPDSVEGTKKCSYCAKPFVGEDSYYFHCRYCEQDFCNEHRLPENHLCKSSPIRRNIPTTSMPYYATSGGGYYTSSGRNRAQRGSFLNISKQGKILATMVALGLVIGFVLNYIMLGGIPVTDYLVQFNVLVYNGWYLPILTSMIVVYPSSLGLLDVFFNAISIIWVDRLLSYTYSPRQYYTVFILTGVAGNLLSLLNGPNIVSFGASGGIFGLVAGAVTSDYAINGRVNRSLLLWFVIIFFYSSIAGSVDLLAHLGGAVVGLLAGYIAGRSSPLRSRRIS